MRSIEKAICVSFVAGVLVLQLWAIFPPSRGSAWYWPFTNYPMYSTAQAPGSNVLEHTVALRFMDEPTARDALSLSLGASMEDDPQRIVVGPEHLHFHRFSHFRSLNHIAARATGRMDWGEDYVAREIERLHRVLVEHAHVSDFEIQILKKEFTVGARGLETPDPPWRLIHSWSSTEDPALPGFEPVS